MFQYVTNPSKYVFSLVLDRNVGSIPITRSNLQKPQQNLTFRVFSWRQKWKTGKKSGNKAFRFQTEKPPKSLSMQPSCNSILRRSNGNAPGSDSLLANLQGLRHRTRANLMGFTVFLASSVFAKACPAG